MRRKTKLEELAPQAPEPSFTLEDDVEKAGILLARAEAALFSHRLLESAIQAPKAPKLL